MFSTVRYFEMLELFRGIKAPTAKAKPEASAAAKGKASERGKKIVKVEPKGKSHTSSSSKKGRKNKAAEAKPAKAAPSKKRRMLR